MKTYQEMSKEELTQELTALKAEYEKIKGMGLALDMSRGKPGADQLDLSMGMLDVLDSKFRCTRELQLLWHTTVILQCFDQLLFGRFLLEFNKYSCCMSV